MGPSLGSPGSLRSTGEAKLEMKTCITMVTGGSQGTLVLVPKDQETSFLGRDALGQQKKVTAGSSVFSLKDTFFFFFTFLGSFGMSLYWIPDAPSVLKSHQCQWPQWDYGG